MGTALDQVAVGHAAGVWGLVGVAVLRGGAAVNASMENLQLPEKMAIALKKSGQLC